MLQMWLFFFNKNKTIDMRPIQMLGGMSYITSS
jgi:hypothetical protein